MLWILEDFAKICLLLLCFLFLCVFFFNHLRVFMGLWKLERIVWHQWWWKLERIVWHSMTPVMEKEGLQIQECNTANGKSIYSSFIAFLNGIGHWIFWQRRHPPKFSPNFFTPKIPYHQLQSSFLTFPAGLPKHKTSRTQKIHLLSFCHIFFFPPTYVSGRILFGYIFYQTNPPLEKRCVPRCFLPHPRWTASLCPPRGLATLAECL